MVDSVRIAELVIFAILVFPTLYCLFRHRSHGFLGWMFLVIFCILRIVADGLLLANPNGKVGNILANVALSPLLFASLGIIHEARILQDPRRNPKIERIINLVLHLLIAAGIALLAVGIAGLYDPTTSIAGDRRLMKIGLGLTTASWALICIYCASSFVVSQRNAVGLRAGFVLLCATTFALAWIGVRVVYTLVAFTTFKPELNPITGELAIRVVLNLLPGILATVAFIVGGLIANPQIQSNSSDINHATQKSGY